MRSAYFAFFGSIFLEVGSLLQNKPTTMFVIVWLCVFPKYFRGFHVQHCVLFVLLSDFLHVRPSSDIASIVTKLMKIQV